MFIIKSLHNFISDILILRSKSDASKGDVFYFFNSSSEGYISCKSFSNSPPSFRSAKTTIKKKTLASFQAVLFSLFSEFIYPHGNRETS